MILQDLVLPSKQNLRLKYSGIDSIDHCLDKNHFRSYPYEVDYVYNSRGFRDAEWPDSIEELRSAIWCIGDSFTVGIGSPATHSWPCVLSSITGIRTINVSMDGASNQWISRIAQQIINEINPAKIVIMWSYTHRREQDNVLLNHEERRLFYAGSSSIDDWSNFLDCKKNVNTAATDLIEFAIPNYHESLVNIETAWANVRGNDWPGVPATISEFNSLPQFILDELKNLHHLLDDIVYQLTVEENLKKINITKVRQKDVARDGHHFDLITADQVAKQIAQQLDC
jgi:hypothetical protein